NREALVEELEERPLVADHVLGLMYDQSKYDPDNKLCGLLEGEYTYRVARAIFVAPSAALEKSSASNRHGNAHLCRIKRFTPAAVAYVIAQGLFALMPWAAWKREQDGFNLYLFYRY
ncbi:hypothetical protein MPER_11729, partial [Moniliophthora perniciosa FA553]